MEILTDNFFVVLLILSLINRLLFYRRHSVGHLISFQIDTEAIFFIEDSLKFEYCDGFNQADYIWKIVYFYILQYDVEIK